MSTVLFLYTERPTREVFARARPGRMVLASDEVTAADRAVYDECVELPPVTHVRETVVRLERLRPDALVLQQEYALLPGSLLAQRWGLPGPSPESALLCTNKWLSRQALQRAGVPVPRFALVEDAAGVRRFAAGSYPVVLKPVASTLGRLVVRVEAEAQVAPAVERMRAGLPRATDVLRCAAFAALTGFDLGCDPLRQFLVESFADGMPRETDGLLAGPDLDLFGVTAQVVGGSPGFFLEGYLFPVPDAGLAAITAAALRAHRLSDSGFSVEFRGDTVIEVNGRLGEDDGFPELFRAALGQYPILKHIAGDRTPSRPRGGHALAYLNCYRGGVVRSVPAAPAATVLVRAGDRLHTPAHPEFAPHLAWTLESGTDASLAYAAARARLDALTFAIDREEP